MKFLKFKVALLLFLIAGCTSSKQPAKPVLNIAIWSNYLPTQLVQKFEEKQQIKVVISNFSSNEELLAKIQAGGTHYDIIVPSDYMVGIMAQLGLLQELDKSKLSNAADLDPDLLGRPYDKENRYSLPYAWAITGILLNRDLYKGKVEGWKEFFSDPELNGKVSMLDDVRETLGAALKIQGSSVNTTTESEITEAKKYLMKVRSRIRMFTSEPIPAVSNGEIAAAHMYSTDALQVKKKLGDKIEFIIPKEGATIAIDNFAIPKSARNVAAAEQFINFMLETDSNRVLVHEATVGPILKSTKNETPSRQLTDQKSALKTGNSLLESIIDVGKTISQYDRAWTEVKSAM